PESRARPRAGRADLPAGLHLRHRRARRGRGPRRHSGLSLRRSRRGSEAEMIRAALLGVSILLAGCAFGPKALARNQLDYNEVIKSTTEEQLLLNIIRLRYSETPNTLAVSAIAAQYELNRTFQLTPFFVASGAAI